MNDESNLRNYLSHNHIIESSEQARNRKNVIQKLKALIPQFLARARRNRDNGECQLLPFGSYGIGGYVAGADIDLVLLGPKNISRTDFFRNFPYLLKNLAEAKGVESIKRTAVPIIKCTIDSFSIDISFVNLNLPTVPPDINLLDDTLLEDLDEVCVASMDGPRTHQFIMNSILPRHLPVFRTALQVVKHWAMQRALYGKPIGYLNGSSWTFLLLKTYMAWATWDWSRPVMLTKTVPTLKNETYMAYEDLEFQTALIAIMSPCFPVCSSAPFATRSTRQVIMDELERATKILSYFDHASSSSMLDKLFRKLNIFKKYIHFLQICVTTETVKSRETWVRKMAVNIPRLVEFLEEDTRLQYIHPYTQRSVQHIQYRTEQGMMAIQEGDYNFDDSHDDVLKPGSIYSICYLIGLCVDAGEESSEVVDISKPVRSFLADLEGRLNAKDKDVTFAVRAVKRRELFKLADTFQ